jgi:hypothetical protein
MKNNFKFLSSLFLIIVIGSSLYASTSSACSITDLVAEPYECANEQFFVDIDFNFNDVGSSGFTINGNGTAYGTFEYGDLPITLGPLEADCNTNFEFVVKDVDDPNCNNDTSIGVICCEECMMTTLDFGPNPICEEGLISSEWLIDGVNLSQVGFDIYINNDFSTFVEYNDGNWYDFSFEAPASDWVTMKVCDNDNEDCCISIEFPNPCFEDQEECEIWDLVAEPYGCENEVFYVDIDFNYNNIGNQGFQINGNGTSYGTFEFGDLPITLGPLPANCFTSYEFVIKDIQYENCQASIGIGEICCEECMMTTLDFGPNPICNEGLISSEWLIDGVNLSQVGFDIYINNDFATFIQYNDGNWYDFSFEAPPTEWVTMKVCDNDNEECCITIEFENPCYEPQEDCNISGITFENLQCFDPNLVLINDFSFDYENNIGEFYDLYIDGEFFFFFNYNDLPNSFEFETNPNNPIILITVCDNDNDGCCEEIVIENPCYEPSGDCNISGITFESLECLDGPLVLVNGFSFDYENPFGDFYDLFINGDFYGFFSYNDLPNSFEFETNSTIQTITITVCDNDNDGCCEEIVIENPCYESFPEECEIWDLTVDAGDCDPSGLIPIVIDFNYSNAGGDGFSVSGNGGSYGIFEYSSLPITLLIEADCSTMYEFVVTDIQNNDCNTFIEYGEICCGDDTDFDFSQIELETSDCEVGLFSIEVLYDGSIFNPFLVDLYIDEEFAISFILSEDLNISLNNLELPNVESFIISLCENQNNDNCYTFEIENPCFMSSVENDIHNSISVNTLNHQNIVVDNLSNNIINYHLITMSGQTCDYGKFTTGQNSIQKEIPSGMYILMLESEGNITYKRITYIK